MITQTIEKHLEAIGPAEFQTLIYNLLPREGYEFISSPGSVPGKNKTRSGIPDAYLKFGKRRAFCQITTKDGISKKQLLAKLVSDIEECFDYKKTKVLPSDVNIVILAFTSTILPQQEIALEQRLQDFNPDARLVIWSIQAIASAISSHPGFADNYVPGLKTSPTSIFSLPDYLSFTERGLQPGLTNPFCGREQEMKEAELLLNGNDVLVIKGFQGVGKSKFAIELASSFSDRGKWASLVISANAEPIYDRLSQFLDPNRNYIIVFDDANKARHNLDYLLQIAKRRATGSTKVIITVRDYVFEEIKRELANVQHSDISLLPLNDAEIKKIASKALLPTLELTESGLRSLSDLAKGNARIALMAISAINKNGNAQVFSDVLSLYEEYFGLLKMDVADLANPKFLQALGVISFFGSLDKNWEDCERIFETKFNISWADLWEMFGALHRAELVDLHAGESVKISDQVLATYAFHETFISRRSSLRYGEWVDAFLERVPGQIKKSVTDLINAFGFYEVKDDLIRLLKNSKANAVSSGKSERFFETFWFCFQIDTLIYLKNWVATLEKEVVHGPLTFDLGSVGYAWPHKKITLLANYWKQTLPASGEAIKIAISLIEKAPSHIPKVLKSLADHTSFSLGDCEKGFPLQNVLLDVLSSTFGSESRTGESVFLEIAPQFLSWDYNSVEGRNGHMVLQPFTLTPFADIMNLRRKILELLHRAFDSNPPKAMKVLSKFITLNKKETREVIIAEWPHLSLFIEEKLSPQNYSQCEFVFQYAAKARKACLDPSEMENRFLSSEFLTFREIITAASFRRDYDVSREEQRLRIKESIEGKDRAFISSLLTTISELYEDSASRDHLENILKYIFLSLSHDDQELFYETLSCVRSGIYSFKLSHGNFISSCLWEKHLDTSEFLVFINSSDYPQRQSWENEFFWSLPAELVDDTIFQGFIVFLKCSKGSLFIGELSVYMKYEEAFHKAKTTDESMRGHDSVLTYMTEILLSNKLQLTLGFDFCQKYVDIFRSRIDLLKELYFSTKLQNGKMSYDYDGSELKAISTVDHFFVLECLDVLTRDRRMPSAYDSSGFIDVSFVWEYDDHASLFDQSLDLLTKRFPVESNWEHCACFLFKLKHPSETARLKMRDYISSFIQRHHSDQEKMLVIMNVVVHCFREDTVIFLRQLMILNADVTLLDKMCFEPGGVYSGSRVPRIDQKILSARSILSMVEHLPNPLTYQPHVEILNRRISYLREYRESAMKCEFKEAYR